MNLSIAHVGIARLDERGFGGKLKFQLFFFPFLCALLFRGAESLWVSDCDLASGGANVIYKGGLFCILLATL